MAIAISLEATASRLEYLLIKSLLLCRFHPFFQERVRARALEDQLLGDEAPFKDAFVEEGQEACRVVVQLAR